MLVVWIVLGVLAWTVLSLPAAVLVGRLLSGASDPVRQISVPLPRRHASSPLDRLDGEGLDPSVGAA